MIEEVQAAALKRAVALRVHDLMKQKELEQECLGGRNANLPGRYSSAA